MNERIRKLAEQAGFHPEDNWDHTNWHAAGFNSNFEKFAELIVGECVVALEVEIDTWKEMDPYQGSMKRKGATAIKQHFGVEE